MNFQNFKNRTKMENEKKTYEELEKENIRLRNKLSAYEWEGTPEGIASRLHEAQRKLDGYDYDYKAAVKEDAIQAINVMVEYGDLPHELPEGESVEDFIRDMLSEDDNVTGVMSGSYTLNQYEAERNICHNWELVQLAIEEGFDITAQMYPEMIDAQLRLFVLPQVIDEAIEESNLTEQWFWDDNDWANSDEVDSYLNDNPEYGFVAHTYSASEAARRGDAYDDLGMLGYNIYALRGRDYEDGRGGEL